MPTPDFSGRLRHFPLGCCIITWNLVIVWQDVTRPASGGIANKFLGSRGVCITLKTVKKMKCKVCKTCLRETFWKMFCYILGSTYSLRLLVFDSIYKGTVGRMQCHQGKMVVLKPGLSSSSWNVGGVSMSPKKQSGRTKVVLAFRHSQNRTLWPEQFFMVSWGWNLEEVIGRGKPGMF